MNIPSWTYSQLEGFETCPRQYYEVRIAKSIPYVQGEEAKWGDVVHKAFESRIRDKTPLPVGMTQWEGIAKNLEAMKGTKIVEQEFAIDDNFQPVEWKKAWSRGKADLTIVSGSTAAMLDYKTGKRKLTDQLTLYAGYMFAHYPAIEKVSTGFVWLKEKKIDRETFHRKDVPVIWQKFLPRYQRLEAAHTSGKWVPRPSGLCKNYCPVLGCEFNGRR